MIRRIGELLGRTAFTSFFLITSLYCLLAYVPFTYQQVVVFKLLGGLTWFARWQHLLYWPALLAGAAALWPAARDPRTRVATLLLGALLLAQGLALAVRPVLDRIENRFASYVLAFVALVPVLWVAAIDHRRALRALAWAQEDNEQDGRFFLAAVISAAFTALLYLAIFAIRLGQQAPAGGPAAGAALPAMWSLASHLVCFLGAFLLVAAVRALAAYFATPAKVQLLLGTALMGALFFAVLKSIVLAAISFSGPLAELYAAALALALIGLLSAAALGRAAATGQPIASGIGLVLAPLVPPATRWYARAAVLAAIALAAYGTVAKAAAMDWNYLAQKLSALVVWLLVLANVHAMLPPLRLRRAPVLLGAPLLVLALFKTLQAHEGGLAASLDQYAGYDASYKVIRDLLARPKSEDAGIYDFLQRVTNISRDVHIDPVSVDFVHELKPVGEPAPHVFVIVIDSLRRDYLSVYNDKVDFTPNLAEFARDSIAFENAFTHYGATGLSEPSIWVGGMFPHQQYITPFFPMNALQKLIDAEGYQCFISMDTILRSVVSPRPSIVELDRGILNKDFDLCRTLGELEDRLAQRGDDARPIFVYTQPQDIHISRITREGGKPVDDLPYPGFHAPYASRVRRIDRCFGELVHFLKERHLYERSIIVFTADHGDSLGEDGRWGHAYTIFPEVVRIPLLIHVPEALRASLGWDASALSFSTDITPSLYYLLGHPPVLDDPIYGRPLLTRTAAERTGRRRGDELLASSYGPVYGILRDSGRALYIVDAVNYSDYDYDLTDPRLPRRGTPTPELRAVQMELIRKKVGELHALYRVPPLE